MSCHTYILGLDIKVLALVVIRVWMGLGPSLCPSLLSIIPQSTLRSSCRYVQLSGMKSTLLLSLVYDLLKVKIGERYTWVHMLKNHKIM